MKNMKNGCFFPADILLPQSGFEKWSVIACDQYTSEPEYWEKAERNVGSAPSALRLILPEAYLGENDGAKIEEINRNMREYLNGGVFKTLPDAVIYTERRQKNGRLRRGLVGMIDLECYDYKPGARSAVRATEKTVSERIPPRVRIRENAPLELPHVMLLADDPEDTVIAPVACRRESLEKLYDFELMNGGGHIEGFLADDEAVSSVDSALARLREKGDGLLFCVGDGNHSLAAAKAAYEKNPGGISRYALVEIVNIHDSALEFEPIYRAVFGADPETLISLVEKAAGGEYSGADAQKFTCVFSGGERELSLRPAAKLPVGTLQPILDEIAAKNELRIDYIHGEQNLRALCRASGTTGFLFRGMEKSELFGSVLADGSLPRKTFSMGCADDKRFYLEARKIAE